MSQVSSDTRHTLSTVSKKMGKNTLNHIVIEGIEDFYAVGDIHGEYEAFLHILNNGSGVFPFSHFRIRLLS